MALCRRAFLQAASLGAAVAAAPVQAARSLGLAVVTAPRFSIDHDSFKALEGAMFRVGTQLDLPVSLQLWAVERHGNLDSYPDVVRARIGCFNLIFCNESPVALVEGIHAFRTPAGDEFAAFIAPLSRDGRRFQVVFNRL